MNNLLSISLAILVLSPAAARAAECKRYADAAFRYSICAPADWKKTYREEGERHHLALRGRAGAEIAVTASRAGEGENNAGEGWRRRGSRKIIETKKMASGDVTVKIVVFDYYSRGVRMLQRTMFSDFGDNRLVIECRAPLARFGSYTEIFNTVMSSVDYTGKEAGELLEEAPEEKTVLPKKKKPAAKIKPAQKAEPKKPAPKPEPKVEPKKPAPKAEPEKPAAKVKRPERKPQPAPAPEPDGEEKRDAAPKGKREAGPKGEEKSKTGARPKADIKQKTEAGPDADTPKGEQGEIDVRDIEDPEAKSVIESELKTLQDMERRGLIEKLDEQEPGK